MVAPRREDRWAALRRGAHLKLWGWGVALVAVPVLVVGWVLGGVLAVAGWAPAPLAGWLVLAAAALAVAAVVGRRQQRLRQARLHGATIAALDWRRGMGADDERPRRFWQAQWQRATGDPWLGAMIAAATFAVALNTAAWWSGPAGAALGIPYVRTFDSAAALVRLRAVEVVPPDAGQTRTYGAGDGFLQVPEGALVRWRVEPLMPATTATLAIGDGRTLARSVTGPTVAFAAVVSKPTSYRFQLQRWGVERREAVPRRLEVLPDLPPEVRWLERPPDEPKPEQLIRFAWRAADDRAVTAVALELAGDERRVVLPLFAGAASRDTGTQADWIDPVELPRGAVVTMTLIAVDDDRFDGPNVGRSEPVLVRFRSPEERHADWRAALGELLDAEVRLLGRTLEDAPVGGRWLDGARSRIGAAGELARRARDLADESQQVPLVSIDAHDALLRVADQWLLYAADPTRESMAAVRAEVGTWETDRLLGREEAARIEFAQDQLMDRLAQLTDAMDELDDAELMRMFKLLEQELGNLQSAMKDKRKQLPTELVQQDALRDDELHERQDRMSEIREALAQGDRERARELMQQLLDEMQAAREAIESGAGAWVGANMPSPGEVSARQREIEQLRRQQEETAKAMEQVERERHQAAGALADQLRTMRQGEGEGARAAEQLQDALQRGDREGAAEALRAMPQAERQTLGKGVGQLQRLDRQLGELAGRQQGLRQELGEVRQRVDDGRMGSGAVREALDDADRQMGVAADSAEEGKGGEGASAGWQAAEELDRAAGALESLNEQMAAMAEQPRFGRQQEGGEGRGDRGVDGRQNDEPFEAPEASEDPAQTREEVLQGFRTGLPDAGRPINERYLDRLLH